MKEILAEKTIETAKATVRVEHLRKRLASGQDFSITSMKEMFGIIGLTYRGPTLIFRVPSADGKAKGKVVSVGKNADGGFSSMNA
ncbi:hypothetical protein HAX54_016413 [Datura stramonium]|uniref:Uncharacterized protein n=1 Tax=Datura stramonium TaxID=4076 RepID=A0ABS8UK29_DATST|nr:hypothetical protein [Datura stramonium]